MGAAARSSGSLPHALRSIDVEQHAARSARGADRFDVLDDARLVVDVHDRDELGVRRQRLEHGGRLDVPSSRRGDLRHRYSARFERLRDVEHRLVLDARRDQVHAPAARAAQHALQREVVGLRRART